MSGNGELLEIQRKAIRAAQVRKSYAKNPARAKRTAAEWAAANPERAKAHRRTSYLRKMERLGYSERTVLFRSGMKRCSSCLEILSRSEFSSASKNGTRVTAKCKSCRRVGKSGNTTTSLHNRVRTAIRSSLRSFVKSRKTEQLLGYSIETLKFHLEQFFKDGMSWDNFSLWHIDHIRPLRTFNITSDTCEEFRKAWSLENLQPLWVSENLAKGGKWDGY